MREVLALTRADWLAATSYRVGIVMSVGSLLLVVVPIYFIAQALQPVMAESIAAEGGDYFAFLIVGLVTAHLIGVAVTALPTAVQGGIRTGTLEALLSTRTSVGSLLAGMVGYRIAWTGARVGMMFLAGVVLGISVAWSQSLWAALILVLIILAHVPFGVIAAAMVLSVRTQGPIARLVTLASTLLGGVYYPTHVIPSWLQDMSAFLPLTYGLRALRQTLLDGMAVTAVLPDVFILATFVVGLSLLAGMAFAGALRYARRSGTLAQY